MRLLEYLMNRQVSEYVIYLFIYLWKMGQPGVNNQGE